MKIAIIGAGPAGLYFALLMKRQFSGHDIRVFEQNPRGATFGFGVVFSDRALEFLKDDDAATYELITRHLELWPNLTIVHKDRPIVVDGNGFGAIGRLKLLTLLYGECEKQGISIAFETRIEASAGELQQYDLVVGADGINSALRDAHKDRFQTRIEYLSNRFVWYGTSQPFDSLSLTFRTNQDGAFVAHHYRYAPDMSTFIVECDALSYETAGFDAMNDAQSRAYCENLFAADLKGHELQSNNSNWRNFPVVTNGRWHDGKMVLIGDALRSAHFSIGSGTRLAMEDAIALARAFAENGENVPLSLNAYEAARKPVVDKLLAGAEGSYRWYEDFRQRMHLEPLDLAYDYMTRSGRVDNRRLAKIAPHFWAQYAQHG